MADSAAPPSSRSAATTRDEAAPPPPAISVIIPAHNAAPLLARCLDALAASRGVTWECIVVDDGSTDESAAVARGRGARVLRGGARARGPAWARNLGARDARAPLLCFVDADVRVRPDTLARLEALLRADPTLAAVFGSYDAAPEAPGLVSQYRNLLHHFVHQSARRDASTFWAGCGAIRRDVFLAHGGFDTRYHRPSIEDIELGYRLRASGARIQLAPEIQVTHLKRWTFWGMVVGDVRDRALPWTELIVRSGRLPNDLNLDRRSRLSALCVATLAGLLALGGRWRPAWGATPLPLLALLACNYRLYRFLLRERGASFLVRALPLHWLYYAYSAISFAAASLWHRRRRR